MSEPVKIAVCDDESRALAIISASVGGIFEDMGVPISLERFLSPQELLERMDTRAFDLIFLDISMPGMDGVDLGRAIQSMGSTAAIVFVSSRSDRVFDTFSVQPFGFVRKGHFLDDLNEVIGRFAARQGRRREGGETVCFRDGHGSVSIDISRVKYIECVRNTQVLYFDGGAPQHRVYSRMETLERELKDLGFIRVHRGYLVNSAFIGRFDAKTLLLTTGEELPVGRSYHQAAKLEYLSCLSRTGAAFIGR